MKCDQIKAKRRDNITLGNRDISEEAMEQILKDSNCKTFINRLPDGIDTVLSEGGASISSGERQLISIARAFARNPDLNINLFWFRLVKFRPGKKIEPEKYRALLD